MGRQLLNLLKVKSHNWTSTFFFLVANNELFGILVSVSSNNNDYVELYDALKIISWI